MADRAYDIVVFPDAGFNHPQLSSSSIFGSLLEENSGGGAICTGIQKLVQHWLIEFLTARGSMGFHLKDRGTEFIPYLKNRAFLTEVDVKTQFSFAAYRVALWLKASQRADTPNDEQLLSATLEDIQISPGRIALRVKLVSKAGDDVKFVLPLRTAPASLRTTI